MLAALAQADLTKRMEGEFKGAFARLSGDINKVTDRLSDIVSQLRHASGTLRTATTEILSGSNDLSHRTSVQSATIERSSGTMAARQDRAAKCRTRQGGEPSCRPTDGDG